MRFDDIVKFFLPEKMKDNTDHPNYHEYRVLVSTIAIGLPFVLLFPLIIFFIDMPIWGYLANSLLLTTTLFCIKYFGHYRIPLSITALVTYFIIYGWIKDSGLIYSSNLSILHMYLLGAIWADKKYGWYAIFTNLILFVLIYRQTLESNLPGVVHQELGGAFYALIMNSLITVFFGGFLAYLQIDQERDRKKLKELQENKITILDAVVKQRTEQLNTMREAIATDFHDETGNMLSAINRQASLLKLKLASHQETQPIVNSIIQNSNALYAASKDFLWHLHHDSDDPEELFLYLTRYGQLYYNQFDIAFSSTAAKCPQRQLASSAALNIIYIFKEAMTNVVKHAEATEVFFEMECTDDQIIYALQDNGTWKNADESITHYGIQNMCKRCEKNNFSFSLSTLPHATRITIIVNSNGFSSKNA